MKVFFTCLLFGGFLFVTLRVNAQAVTNGLIAYYPFNGNANDGSPYANNGTVSGATLTSDRFGNPNSAYSFNGSSSAIIISSSASLESPAVTHAVTQTAWVYLRGLSLVGLTTFAPVIMKSNSEANAFMYRLYMSYSILASGYNNYFVDKSVGYTFNLNQWYFVAMTFNESRVKTYVNGVLLDSSALNATILLDKNSLTIGKDAPGATEYFNGNIDDVAIYNRDLSENEIRSLYTSAAPLPVVFTGFTANRNNENITLQWDTRSESNGAYYSIERSTNGSDYTEVGKVKSTNQLANTYQFIDKDTRTISNKNVFYRIKQVDIDGRYKYSTVAKIGLNNIQMTRVYPNPTSASLFLNVQTQQAGPAQITVVNIDGKTMYNRNYNIMTGSSTILLDVSNLKNGSYIITFKSKSIKETFPFVKQ